MKLPDSQSLPNRKNSVPDSILARRIAAKRRRRARRRLGITAIVLLMLMAVGIDNLASMQTTAAPKHQGNPRVLVQLTRGLRQVVGCTGGKSFVASHGSRARPMVALTFDDGPSLRFTPKILAILNRNAARATFFEEGRHIHHRHALMREILASGDEIGNHSFTHPLYPGNWQLAATNRGIDAATGFTPCLFRPPYGGIDYKVRRAASTNHLEIIMWDVDSRDDKHPGITKIQTNATGLARNGSIILMHDGGHHPQTVAALPAVIRGLRARGFRFTTVSQLLGGHFLYKR